MEKLQDHLTPQIHRSDNLAFFSSEVAASFGGFPHNNEASTPGLDSSGEKLSLVKGLSLQSPATPNRARMGLTTKSSSNVLMGKSSSRKPSRLQRLG